MHGVGVGVGLLDDRGQDVRRQVAQRPRHLLAHVLGRALDVALEHELAGDAGVALGGHGEVSSSRPLMVESASSRGRTTWVVISSGVAPGRRMLMLTVAGSARGKRSTPRSRNEKMPSTTRKRSSITAKTAAPDAQLGQGHRWLDCSSPCRRGAPSRSSWPSSGHRHPSPSFRPSTISTSSPLARAELDLRLLERALLDRVDLVDAVDVAQRVLGHDAAPVHLARRDAGAREEARLEHAVAVVEQRLDLERCGSAGPTDGFMREIVPLEGPARDRPRPAPSPAGRPRPSPPSSPGTLSRTRSGSLSTMTITGVCTFTYWPGVTMRSFTWPAKGARITVSPQLLVGQRHATPCAARPGRAGSARSARPCRRRRARSCSAPPPRRSVPRAMRPCVEELLRALVLLLGVRAVGLGAATSAASLASLSAGCPPAARAGPGSAAAPRAPGRGPGSARRARSSPAPVPGHAVADVHVDLVDAALDLGADRHLLEREERAHGLDVALDLRETTGTTRTLTGLCAAGVSLARPAMQPAPALPRRSAPSAPTRGPTLRFIRASTVTPASSNSVRILGVSSNGGPTRLSWPGPTSTASGLRIRSRSTDTPPPGPAV